MFKFFLAMLGCSPSVPVEETPPEVPEPVLERFDATLQIDPRPRYKRFQGVWLLREGGERLLVDYRARSLWTPFADQLVEVEGAVYEPEGQALKTTHFEVRRLALKDQEDPDLGLLVEVLAASERVGHFERVVGEAGSKEEGEAWFVFVSGGVRFRVYNPEEIDERRHSVVALSREVRWSKFVAHSGDRWLFLIDVRR